MRCPAPEWPQEQNLQRSVRGVLDRQELYVVECLRQVPKPKPGSGPQSNRKSDFRLGAEDEDALVLDPDMIAPRAMGAPAARLAEEGLPASPKPQTAQQEVQVDSAMAGESAPELASLGRRLAPGAASGPAGLSVSLGRSTFNSQASSRHHFSQSSTISA